MNLLQYSQARLSLDLTLEIFEKHLIANVVWTINFTSTVLSERPDIRSRCWQIYLTA